MNFQKIALFTSGKANQGCGYCNSSLQSTTVQAVCSFMLDNLIVIQVTLCFRKGHLEMSVVILGTGRFSAILEAKTSLGYKGINLYPNHICNLEFLISWWYSSALHSAGFHFMALILITGEKNENFPRILTLGSYWCFDLCKSFYT